MKPGKYAPAMEEMAASNQLDDVGGQCYGTDGAVGILGIGDWDDACHEKL